MSVLDTMQKCYKQPDLAAREWKKRGGKVIGYFCNAVPEELILAAGFFPLRIRGNPGGNTDVIDKYLEPFYEGFVRTQLNAIITGKYDFVDYLIIPRSRDSIAQQYSHLSMIKELDPAINLPDMYLFEFIHTRSYMSQFYTLGSIRELKDKLEEWSGKTISNKMLLDAIAITNENRELLKKVAALRITEPPCISGVEALQIIGSSMFMLKEDHNKLLKQLLSQADHLRKRNGARLFVESSPLDNLDFYKIVESCNATVVAEDNCWGNRYSDDSINTFIDPIEAVAWRYHYKSPCPYNIFPAGLRKDYCLKAASEAKVQGAIFNILEWDPAQTWDYPEQKKVLEENNIPTLCFRKQKYQLSDSDRDEIQASIKEFIKTITKQ